MTPPPAQLMDRYKMRGCNGRKIYKKEDMRGAEKKGNDSGFFFFRKDASNREL